MSKRLVILATERYHVNFNDFYMFFRRTPHQVVAVLFFDPLREHRYWAKDGKCRDRGRRNVLDKFDYTAKPFIPWSTDDELLERLSELEFDYICMGNGSEVIQKRVVEAHGNDRCLFSEYGWLPWDRHFYISRKGCGMNSEIAEFTAQDLARRTVQHEALQELRRHFHSGWPVWRKDFVYVPLQKDVDDFKFNYTHFSSNESFLDFIHELVPPDMKVLVKRHPLYQKKYNFRKYGRFVDISGKRFNKAQLYRRMAAMICINSTSILEAILFGGRVFAYGEDLFLNKDLVAFGVDQRQQFEQTLASPFPTELGDAFISLLMERQVDRARCVSNDREYMANHYWNTQL